MDKIIEKIRELSRNEFTEYIYDITCFGEPVALGGQKNIEVGINRALKLNEYPMFLEGLSERLTALGKPCKASDTDIILTEVKRRYKDILGKNCPRTVIEWMRGKVPGITNRRNNYELCYALEMDYNETAEFFQKSFLTIPFNAKNRTDAVFLYCLYHKKTYAAADKMLVLSDDFVPQEQAHTATSQIISVIMKTDDDEKFLEYLSAHCYNNEQQFQLARNIINSEINIIKENILKSNTRCNLTPNRLNSKTIEELFNFSSQSNTDSFDPHILPKRFTESLPNDVTLGQVINGKNVSYELLRKTLMLLRFNNFYREAENTDRNIICCNLLDFYDELNSTLISCGFAQIYVCHPFDCLLLYCANSYEPIVTLHNVIEYGRN